MRWVNIVELLEFILNTTYLSFQGQIYQQLFGTAISSPVSPFVTKLCMEDLEQRAIASTPKFWKRYVNDYLEIIKRGSAEKLRAHLNTGDPTGSIKFTHEEDRG